MAYTVNGTGAPLDGPGPSTSPNAISLLGIPVVGGPSLAFVGVAAFLGHLFPVFFKFKGGKGVATAAGVLLALAGVALQVSAEYVVVAMFCANAHETDMLDVASTKHSALHSMT